MLQAVAMLAPRSVYVCGNTTTTTGMTVTVTKDSNGDSGLEAGALVLADQGVCIIDEFDKLNIDYQALLEAMEQQSVSIAKAGILCTLNARSTVLAAANPVGGHYNRERSVSENLKMKAALLSRFDLIFVLLDRPDTNRDALLADHIMNLHAHKPQKRARKSGRGDHTYEDNEPVRCTLPMRLQQNAFDLSQQVLALSVMRNYITYAKTNIRPRLSPQAATLLQDKYLEMRGSAAGESRGSETVPITTRQLESLIRLAQVQYLTHFPLT